MPYVRFTLLTPRDGNRERVQQLQDQLLAFFAAQPGFEDGYRLTSNDRLGRVTVWSTESEADAVANSQHVLALRSQLLPLVENDQELAFTADRVPSSLGTS